jgi:hypothetical protein
LTVGGQPIRQFRRWREGGPVPEAVDLGVHVDRRHVAGNSKIAFRERGRDSITYVIEGGEDRVNISQQDSVPNQSAIKPAGLKEISAEFISLRSILPPHELDPPSPLISGGYAVCCALPSATESSISMNKKARLVSQNTKQV